MKATDTITAPATPWGEGGIGIVRISGPLAPEIARKVFRLKDPEIKERYLHYGRIVDPLTDTTIDDGFLVYMKGPRSYTGEEVVELHCHGGPLILQKVVEVVIKNGARLAEPGEFTKQAFLNGKMDLTQAEAVCEVIKARTDTALRSARGRLEGRLSKRIHQLRDILVEVLVPVEAELDFPEDGLQGLSEERFLEHLSTVERGLKRLINTYSEGAVLKYGIKTLILGRPNVGKSSLLNVLLREERAIVAPLPGTTRDIIEDTINIRGLPVRIMDTAGLRSTDDYVESMGVRMARQRIEDAELVLFVLDSSVDDFREDVALLQDLREKKVIIVANKVDLVDDSTCGRIESIFKGYRLVFTSALHDRGIERLKDSIYTCAVGKICSQDTDPGEFITSLRQKRALEQALECVARAKNSPTRELQAEDIKGALTKLSEFVGEITTEDILDRIFSEFCIGK